jgi:uncharacterized membrane protein (UPF0127 family)
VQRLLLPVIASATLLSCTHSDADVVDGRSVIGFDTTVVHLVAGKDTLTIHAEVARSAEQKTMGLMERRSLPDTAGMLFLYGTDQPANAGFWMFRTHIPLDIAFADSSGRIVAIRQMIPCEAQLAAGCPSYEPGQAYRVALEVNAGVLSRHRVAVGSRLWTLALPSSFGAAR